MMMICLRCAYDGETINKTSGRPHVRRERDEARARLSWPPLYTSRECSVMKVRTSDDGNFGRRARFRRATREDGDGGARRGRMTTGAARNPLGSPRSRAVVEGERRARARARTAW